jgi:subtilisin-like proprotein convertase family protein
VHELSLTVWDGNPSISEEGVGQWRVSVQDLTASERINIEIPFR